MVKTADVDVRARQAHRNNDAQDDADDDDNEEEIEKNKKKIETTGLGNNKIVWNLKEGIR